MLDFNGKISVILTHEIPSAIVGICMMIIGAVNKFFPDLPSLHEIISDTTMFIGALTCAAAFIVQYYRVKTASLMYERIKRESNKIELIEDEE